MKLQSHKIIKPDISASDLEIREQLGRILSSADFHATPQQADFLIYVVEETLAGRAAELKGYSVATNVFGRSVDFNPSSDPIVSMQANKLRRALERYYLTSGAEDPLRLEIPKGCYVPTFTLHQRLEGNEVSSTGKFPSERFDEVWPIIECLPFHNYTGDTDKEFLGHAISVDLAVEVGITGEVTTIVRTDGEIKNHGKKARFAMHGSFGSNESGIIISTYLTDRKSGALIFSDIHETQLNYSQFLASQKDITSGIAAKINGEQGVIAHILMQESKKMPLAELTSYQAILRYQQFIKEMTDENAVCALEALDFAVKAYPDCGLVHSLLARLYTDFYSLGIQDFEDKLDRALSYAEKGVGLEPNNRKALLTLSWVYFQRNNLKAAQMYLSRAKEVSHGSLSDLDSIGYLTSLMGQWEEGTVIIRRAMSINPYYSTHVHYALWLDCLRQHNYQQAYLETTGLIYPSVFWYPLAKAVSLGLLGKGNEAEKFSKQLLTLQPDFIKKGRLLIGRYIKSEKIQATVIEGLSKTGIEI